MKTYAANLSAVCLFNQYFKQIEYQTINSTLKFYGIPDNYLLDEFCQLYYETYNHNPYFVNKWYAMELLHKNLAAEIHNNNISADSRILELGAGLGITASYLKKLGLNLVAIDNEFLACYITLNTAAANSQKISAVSCDWNFPAFKNKFDAIIGCDIIMK